MSFEFIVEKDDSIRKLSKSEEVSLVKKVVTDFESFNSKRSGNLEMASNLANEIFFKN